MKKALKISCVAFVIVFSLMFFMTSCFGGNTPTTNTPNNPPEQPHVCVFGAWETITEATNTEDGLRERRCECGEVEQEVIKSSNTEYYIQYRNVKSVYPEEYGYNSSEGLILPWIEEEGYRFLGWYTELIGGDFIDEIPIGSTKNYILYAHWERIEYTITYFDASIHTNPLTYNIENDTIKLTDPLWSGLSFAYWTDDNGNQITEIKKGSIGNISLTANWRYYENLCMSSPSTSNIISSIYDEPNNLYRFLYKVGEIDNVVLKKYESFDKHFGEELSWQKTESFGVEDTIASSVALSIAQTVSNSTGWSQTSNSAESYSNSKNWSMSADAEFEIFDWFKFGISGSQGGSTTNQDSWSLSTVNSSSHSVGSGMENSFSSSISYKNSSSISLTRSIDVPAEMPAGTYTLACVGKVSVYVIITYDPETKDYHMDACSTLEDGVRSATLYTMFSDSKVSIVENEPLKFDIPMDELNTYIKSSYYQVKYDANGGDGDMPTSIFYSGIQQPLHQNKFTRSGYTFVGWKYQSKTNTVFYQDCANITDLAPIGESVILEAQWVGNDYTVTFDTNGGNINSPTHTVTFGETYGKKQTLPTPIREGYTFGGWYYGDKLIYDNVTVDIPENHTLTAQWLAKSYTVTFNGNGGTVDLLSKNVSYASTYGDLPTASREGYHFVGWSTAQTGGEQITYDSPTTSEGEPLPITLYAQWTAKKYRVTVYACYVSQTYVVQHDQEFSTSLSTVVMGDISRGYDFKGWYFATRDECTTARPSTIAPSGGLITLSETLTLTVTSQTPVHEDPNTEYDGRIYIAAYLEEKSCFTGDTLVTLADATQMRVDELTGDEMLLVWNLETGRYEAAPIVFVDSEDETECEIVHLYFSDGSDVKVIYEHGFFDIDLGKYVYIDASNYADYIGHRFVKQGDIESDTWNEVTLDRVVIETKVTTAWSPVTSEHLCYYTNGILSMPGGIDGLFNIFEVDTDTMTYDAEKMAKDIETYGLYTYEDYGGLIPEEAFVAFNGDWLKVAIGKGMLNWEDIERLVERYIPLM